MRDVYGYDLVDAIVPGALYRFEIGRRKSVLRLTNDNKVYVYLEAMDQWTGCEAATVHGLSTALALPVVLSVDNADFDFDQVWNFAVPLPEWLQARARSLTPDYPPTRTAPESLVNDDLVASLAVHTRRLGKLARVLPADMRAEALETATDVLNERAVTVRGALALFVWVAAAMIMVGSRERLRPYGSGIAAAVVVVGVTSGALQFMGIAFGVGPGLLLLACLLAGCVLATRLTAELDRRRRQP